MAVNYSTPSAEALYFVSGIRLGIASAGIKKTGCRDLTLIELAPGTRVAGVFTRNRFCAAPVTICREHLTQNEEIRALVINTGNANAGTGEQGIIAAQKTCHALVDLLGIEAEAVLPFSTGVILEPLPVERLIAALPEAKANLDASHWHEAAHAIMTTDTVAKAASKKIDIDGKTITVTGIAKGAGMIRPNMATMLGFVATDAGFSQTLLDQLVKESADHSFNCISIDGDTSTNDSFILMATGKSGVICSSENDPAYQLIREAVFAVALQLAQAIVRDGEGATKFISVHIEQGKNRDECRQVGYAIAHSPLIKTAFFASDPNLGRILAAIGYAGIDDLEVGYVNVWLSSNGEEILVVENGGRAASYKEEDGARIMKAAEIGIRVALGRGNATSIVYSCDLSYEYVRINADYRS